MIGHLRDGNAQLVICKDFSRFFRDYTEIGDYLERIFPFLGVRFISVNDGYDSDDYKGTTAGMEVVMKYIIYSFYSRDLSQKMKASIDVRMKAGEYLGRYAPFGYMMDPDKKHHLVPDPETAHIVRRIFDLAISGHHAGEIARVLNDDGIETPSSFFRRNNPENGRFRNTSSRKCWDGTNIRVILQRFEYTGACVFKKKAWKGIDNPKTKTLDKSQWMIVPGCHEPIISEDEYNKAQAVIRRLKAGQPSVQSYPLRSLIRCGVCGRMMKRNSYCKHINYSCTLSQHSANPDCPVQEHFPEDKLEVAVIGSLRQILMLLVEHKKLVDTAASKSKGSKANLQQSLLRIEKSMKQNKLSREAAYEKYVDGQITREDFLCLRDKLAGELAKLSEEKAHIESDLAAYEAAEDSELTLLGQEAESFLKAKEVTNQMLLHFIDRVYVYSGMRIEIKYRFSDELVNLLDDGHAQETDNGDSIN